MRNHHVIALVAAVISIALIACVGALLAAVHELRIALAASGGAGAVVPTLMAIAVWGLLLLMTCIGGVGHIRRRYSSERKAHYRAINQCERCAYDLTGNVSGRCPECGKTTEPSGDARE